MSNLLWRKPPGNRFLDGKATTEPTPDELELLIDILEEVDSPEYDRLLVYVAAKGDAAIGKLAQILERSQGFRALVILYLLSDLGGDQANDILYHALLNRTGLGADQLADQVAIKLDKRGGLSAERLIAALNDPRPEVRARAAWYAHWITAPDALPRIVEAMLPLAEDPDAPKPADPAKASSNPVLQPQQLPIGSVHLVQEDSRFVLIRTSRLTSVSPDAELLTYDMGGRPTGKLKISPERKSGFLAADIVEGHPQTGDRVLMYGYQNGEGAVVEKPGDPIGAAEVLE